LDSFYIYSTPSIPTTETTHGFCEESILEEERKASWQKAPHWAPRRTPNREEGTTEGTPRREEDPPQDATQALKD
jgi:hypothetical protein